MNENGTLIPGTLDAFRAAGPFTLECTWHDIYGSGPAGFTFSGDMMSFTGWWGTGEDPEEYYWRGYRSRTEPDQLPGSIHRLKGTENVYPAYPSCPSECS